jgi:hypothetical protein
MRQPAAAASNNQASSASESASSAAHVTTSSTPISKQLAHSDGIMIPGTIPNSHAHAHAHASLDSAAKRAAALGLSDTSSLPPSRALYSPSSAAMFGNKLGQAKLKYDIHSWYVFIRKVDCHRHLLFT